MPPRVAPLQVVIVPIFYQDKDNEGLRKRCNQIMDQLKKHDIRVHLDDREGYTPFKKYAYWELKGVPLRFDVGPMDLEKGTVTIVRRDKEGKSAKEVVTCDDALAKKTLDLMDEIHKGMFEKAKKILDERTVQVLTWEKFTPALDGRNMVLAPFCKDSACEDQIKDKSKKEGGEKATIKADLVEGDEKMEEGLESLTGAAKSLNMPFVQPPLAQDAVCFHCGKKALTWCLFGRSY